MFEGPSMGPSFAGPRFSTDQKTDPFLIYGEGKHFSYHLQQAIDYSIRWFVLTVTGRVRSRGYM
jgi:hypothetical protein